MTTINPPSEPSMDDILASIRQIISTDPKDEKKSLPNHKEPEDILDLTEILPEEAQNTEVTMDEKTEESQEVYSTFRKKEPKLPSEKPSEPREVPVDEPKAPLFGQAALHSEKEPLFKPNKETPDKLLNERTEGSSLLLPSETNKSENEVSSLEKKPVITQQNEVISDSSSPKNTFEGMLVSQTAMSEATQALHSLQKLAQEKPKPQEPRLNDGIGGQTVENLVRETLRPLLKEWLDTNLPSLVRWVVNEQVEKIVHQLGVTPTDSNVGKTKSHSKSGKHD